MEYMFLIYLDEAARQAASPESKEATVARTWKILDDASSAGVLKAASPLRPVATAVTARTSGGRLTLTDGPFAETKEVLAGYWIIDCRDEDDAKAWASRICQTGCGATVEMRAISPLPPKTATPQPSEAGQLVNV